MSRKRATTNAVLTVSAANSSAVPRPRRSLLTEEPLILLVLVLAIAYFARDILIPLAIALTLNFLLAPAVIKLQRRKVNRLFAVGLVVVLAFTIVGGVGWIVASQLLARIGDWRELKNIRQLAGFLGLVPSEYSTGERTDRGSITRTGDGRLRSKLIQASWSAIRQDDELREFFRSVCGKHPREIASRVAIVAVTRKLSVRISVVLMKQRPYELRKKVHSAPLTQEETSPQGTTRRLGEPGDKNS